MRFDENDNVIPVIGGRELKKMKRGDSWALQSKKLRLSVQRWQIWDGKKTRLRPMWYWQVSFKGCMILDGNARHLGRAERNADARCRALIEALRAIV